MEFYYNVLRDALATGRITTKDSALAICAGTHDRNSYFRHGFEDVTISNVNDYMGDEIAPYKWQHIDAENIPLPDKSVDIVSVHGGLHHCYSPHRAMLEMYRVARKAVIVMEARDSLVMRMGVAAKFTDDYEIEAVTGSNHFGGAGGGPIPNFIYRWTEAEVHKAIATFEPRYPPDIDFFYGLLLPTQRMDSSQRPLMRMALRLAAPIAWVIQKVMPSQGNRFGWVVWKTEQKLHPWLKNDANGETKVDFDYVRQQGRIYVPVNPEVNEGNPGLKVRELAKSEDE
jgi:SAM-dependent methyltransferase